MRVRPVIFLAVLAAVATGLSGTAKADRDNWGHGRGWGGPLFSFGLSVPAYAPPPVYYAPPPPPVYYAPPPPQVYYAPSPQAYYAPPPPGAYYPPAPVVVVPPALSIGVSIPVR